MRDINCRMPGSRLPHEKGKKSLLLRCPDGNCNRQFSQRLDDKVARCPDCGLKWEWGTAGRVVRLKGRSG